MGSEELSEYELQRLEKIRQNEQLLKDLDIQNAASQVSARSRKADKPKPPKRQRIKKENEQPERVQPRRISSRLQGIEADSEKAKRKAEEEEEIRHRELQLKRMRKTDEYKLEDVNENGWDAKHLVKSLGDLDDHVEVEPSQGQADAKEFAKLRKDMNSLQIFDRWDPVDIRITQDRIFCMGMHPSTTKKLVFAGDKFGLLGVWDVEGDMKDDIKAEAEEDDDPEAERKDVPLINQYKIHTRTISSMCFDPIDAKKLYTTSYDCSIRAMDLSAGKSYEAYGPEDKEDNSTLLSEMDIHPEGNMVYYSTLVGNVGVLDLRAKNSNQFELHERKIGGISLHPSEPHLLSTASLDRSMCIWDVRKFSNTKSSAQAPLAEYESKLSVSAAYWNSEGSVITTSYDDTIGVFRNLSKTVKQGSVSDSQMIKPTNSVKHNNQTGRWVTIFRARWHRNPPNGTHKFIVGNMNRQAPLTSSSGRVLSQFSEPEKITAVPAVAQFHPNKDWVVAGTASGKAIAYFPPEEFPN